MTATTATQGALTKLHRPRKLRLFFDPEQLDSQRALKLVLISYWSRVEVVHADSKKSEIEIPWLSTPFGFFHGLEDISIFIEEEKHTPIVKPYLKGQEAA